MSREREAALRIIRDLQNQIDEWNAWVKRFDELAERHADTSAAAVDQDESDETTNQKVERVSTPTFRIRQEAAKIIESRASAVPLSELTATLTRRGIVIGGRNPAANLSAKLAQDERFMSIRGEGWTLVKFTEREAGDEPSVGDVSDNEDTGSGSNEETTA